MAKKLTFPLLLILLIAAAAASASNSRSIKAADKDEDEDACVYTVFIKTGEKFKAGTDSKIGLELAGTDGLISALIPDLEAWGGLMPPDHDYFEKGGLDIFSGRGPCLPSSLCWMNLTSDASGAHHGWYCDYVDVSVAGLPNQNECFRDRFRVDQWLARDASPYQLYAERTHCLFPKADD